MSHSHGHGSVGKTGANELNTDTTDAAKTDPDLSLSQEIEKIMDEELALETHQDDVGGGDGSTSTSAAKAEAEAAEFSLPSLTESDLHTALLVSNVKVAANISNTCAETEGYNMVDDVFANIGESLQQEQDLLSKEIKGNRRRFRMVRGTIKKNRVESVRQQILRSSDVHFAQYVVKNMLADSDACGTTAIQLQDFRNDGQETSAPKLPECDHMETYLDSQSQAPVTTTYMTAEKDLEQHSGNASCELHGQPATSVNPFVGVAACDRDHTPSASMSLSSSSAAPACLGKAQLSSSCATPQESVKNASLPGSNTPSDGYSPLHVTQPSRIVKTVQKGLEFQKDAQQFLMTDDQCNSSPEAVMATLQASLEDDSMSTCYSGIESAHTATNCNAFALSEATGTQRIKVPMYHMIEWDKENQKELLLVARDHPNCCLFGDVSSFYREEIQETVIPQLKDTGSWVHTCVSNQIAYHIVVVYVV